MSPDFHPIVNGIYLLIGIQLFLVAILQFVYSTKRQYALALICMIFGLWFFRRFFWDFWYKYPLLIVLIGGYKEVFVGPLILFHLRLKWRKIEWKEVLLHFAIPTILYLNYVITRIYFIDFYNEIKQFRFWSLIVFLWIWSLLYFYLGIKEQRIHLKPKLIRRARIRIAWFFYLYFAYQFLSYLTTTLSQIALRILPDSEFWAYLNGTIIYYQDWWIAVPFRIIVAAYIIIYAISETPYFKKVFLSKEISRDIHVEENLDAISKKIEAEFFDNKAFLKPELNLPDVLLQLGISKKEFSHYLKANGYDNYSAFINRLRVEEFKELIKKETNKKYDLFSISTMAGFGSKATFNRVFKNMEGMTPKQYIAKIEKEL